MVRKTRKQNKRKIQEGKGPSSSLAIKSTLGLRRSSRLTQKDQGMKGSDPVPNVQVAIKRRRKETITPVVEENVNEGKDDQQLLSIFPKELWTGILNFVTDSKDFSNVCNASPFFRSILWSKRTISLFPQVWEVLGMKYETDDDEAYCGYDLKKEDVPLRWMECQRFESMSGRERVGLVHLLGGPYYRDILSIRLVCRPWNFVLDQFYERLARNCEMKHDPDMSKLKEDKDESEEDEDDEDNNNDSNGWWSHITFYEKDYAKIHECLEHFEQTHSGNGDLGERSPFIGRSVTFHSRKKEWNMPCCGPPQEVENEDGGPAYWAAITSLLLKYGHHIWYCSLEIEDTFPTRREYYFKIKEWLDLMPNLKTLSLIYSKMGMTSAHRFGRRQRVNIHSTRQELTQFKRAGLSRPLSKLNQLEYMYTENLPNPVYHELVGKNNHILMLESKRDMKFPLWSYDMGMNTFDNLTQLSLQIFSISEFNLLESSQGDWKLDKLYLSFKHCPYLPWNRIFVMMEKWGETLTNVLLKLPKAELDDDVNQVMKECRQYKLKLPQVKRFLLKMYNFSSVDFIFPMKNMLEWFDVTFGCDTKKWEKTTYGASLNKKQQIQVLGYFDNLKTSNIWILFPKLKRIDLLEIYKLDQTQTGYWSGTRQCERECTRKQWKDHWATRNTRSQTRAQWQRF